MSETAHPMLWENGYLEGLLRMAAADSEWIGRSYLLADCFPKGDAAAAFSAWYEKPAGLLRLEETDETLADALGECLGRENDDLRRVNDLVYLIGRAVGECGRILRPVETDALFDALGGEDGGTGFWFVEDLFCAEFEKADVFFLMGNNE